VGVHDEALGQAVVNTRRADALETPTGLRHGKKGEIGVEVGAPSACENLKSWSNEQKVGVGGYVSHRRTNMEIGTVVAAERA